MLKHDLYGLSVYLSGSSISSYNEHTGAITSPFAENFEYALSNPRIQGGLQAFAGGAEAFIGGSLTLGSGGVGGLCGGGLLMSHGLDQFFTGMRTTITGRHGYTVTEELLMTTGMSSGSASLLNDSASLFSTMGAIKALQVQKIDKAFRVPQNYSRNIQLGKQILEERKIAESFTKESNNWTKNSLFKNKTAKELDQMFKRKKFEIKGPDPLNGKGSYINPKNKRKYYIDSIKNGRYREPSHIDILRPENYTGSLRKKRMIYKNE